MYPLLETIKIKNNILCNLEYHNTRLNNARFKLLGLSDTWDLNKIIKIGGLNRDVVYKCRFLYGKEPGEIEIKPYSLPKISTLKIVTNNSIDYTYKYSNREQIELLKSKSGDADDILIVKNGFITDTSFANIVFFDGSRWVTSMYPLLRGIKRQYYIDRNIIFEKEILAKDIRLFSKACIINAMIDLEESAEINIDNIF